MREWWHDLLINAGGGLIGTVLAAAVIALAGKASGLFEQGVAFKPGRFAEVLGAAAGLVAATATVVDVLFSR